VKVICTPYPESYDLRGADVTSIRVILGSYVLSLSLGVWNLLAYKHVAIGSPGTYPQSLDLGYEDLILNASINNLLVMIIDLGIKTITAHSDKLFFLKFFLFCRRNYVLDLPETARTYMHR
jgi:hypothetical protein